MLLLLLLLLLLCVRVANTTGVAKAREANVPIISSAVCNERQSYDGEIDASMICAGYAQGGRGACGGDSGGRSSRAWSERRATCRMARAPAWDR